MKSKLKREPKNSTIENFRSRKKKNRKIPKSSHWLTFFRIEISKGPISREQYRQVLQAIRIELKLVLSLTTPQT